jgi:hypothetical protein
VDPVVLIARRTVWFLGVAVMAGRHRAGGGDDRVDNAVPRRSGDDRVAWI